uniref:Resistance to inhibitors of cholinesterase protein 3 N-terminal domain-containing protein n=1 Tax=Amphilophus citrinellus TaxID=61819 RepID=A0A3Q0QTF4_AMPCI
MAMSAFQKVTLATCLVLCVALLLPKMLLSRGRKDAAERPEGRFPPMMHRQTAPESRGQRAVGSGTSRAHNPEATGRAKGAGTGAGAGGKSNLAGQIIPVYGFGILLYILYILFKITSKGNSKPSEARFPPSRTENLKRKITDFQLAQLQEKLRETEMVMEKIVSNAHHSPDRWVCGVMADQEESLLQQLTAITQMMQEGQLVEGMAPEKKPQDDWEDYPEESHAYWEHSHCCCKQQHHSPQAEAERTDADGADLVENLPEDVTSGDEAERAEDLSKEAVKESDSTAASREDVGSERNLGINEEEDVHEHKKGGGQIDLSVPEEDLVGVLKELELTLRMTSVAEQEKIEDLTQPADSQTACSSVRRRNKRRRAKKDVN